MICDNTKNITLVPTAAFEILAEDNPHKNCGTEDVNKLDLQGLISNGGIGNHRRRGKTKHNIKFFIFFMDILSFMAIIVCFEHRCKLWVCVGKHENIYRLKIGH